MAEGSKKEQYIGCALRELGHDSKTVWKRHIRLHEQRVLRVALAKHATEEINNQRRPLGKGDPCPGNQRM